MATTTPRFKWTAPADTDTVRQGAAAMRAMGGAIENAPVLGNEWVVLPTVGTATIVSGAWSAVLFDLAALTASTVRDALAAVDTAGVNVPANKPGLYLVAFTVSWAGSSGGGRRIIGPAAGQNIAPATTYQQMTTSTAAVAITHSGAWLWSQGGPAGRIALNVYQDSGASLALTSARYSIIRLGSTL